MARHCPTTGSTAEGAQLAATQRRAVAKGKTETRWYPSTKRANQAGTARTAIVAPRSPLHRASQDPAGSPHYLGDRIGPTLSVKLEIWRAGRVESAQGALMRTKDHIGDAAIAQ